MDKMDFCIIGPGRLGTAMAVLLHRAGWPFNGAAGRRLASAERACDMVGSGRAGDDASALASASRLVMITTPDDVIAGVCRSVADRKGFRGGAVVVHCSGVLTAEVLDPAARCGAHTGSLHPLQAFADAGEAVEKLPGAFCCIEGDEMARGVLGRMAADLDLHPLHVPGEKKKLYHAGAVMASNFMVALQDMAQQLGQEAGMNPEEAAKAFRPLVRGTLENLENFGTVRALTGPFARGDGATIRGHLDHIGRGCPELLPAYRALGERALRLGLQQGGVSAESADIIREMLRGENPGQR